MRQFSLIILFAGLLPGCALTNPFSTLTSEGPATKSQSVEQAAHKQSAQPQQITQATPEAIAAEANTDTTSVQQAEPSTLEQDQKQVADNSDVIATESEATEQDQNTTSTTASIVEDVFVDEEEETTYPGVDVDIWDRIRGGFALEEREHKRITQQLKWFASHQEYMDRVAERAQPYMHHIVETLEANDVPLEIALLPIVESAFKPFAYSHGRASGIWNRGFPGID